MLDNIASVVREYNLLSVNQKCLDLAIILIVVICVFLIVN